MTPEGAVYAVLSRVGVPVYASTSVPEDAAYPYATYDLSAGEWWDGEMPLTVSLWSRGSEAEANATARALSQVVGTGAYQRCDGGAVLVRRGAPFCQSMGDATDDQIKRRYVNLTVEYLLS